MQKVSLAEQKVVSGGHSHWRCSLNGFTSKAYNNKTDAVYQAGVHAGKYGHQKYVSVYSWCFAAH